MIFSKGSAVAVVIILLPFFSDREADGQKVIKLLASQDEKLVADVPTGIFADNAFPLRPADSIQIKGGTPPYSFAWYEGNVRFSQDQELEIVPTPEPVNYKVIISDSRNCKIESVLTIMVRIEGLILPVKIYPVPAQSYLVIDPLDPGQEFTMSIYTPDGKRIRELNIMGKKK